MLTRADPVSWQELGVGGGAPTIGGGLPYLYYEAIISDSGNYGGTAGVLFENFVLHNDPGTATYTNLEAGIVQLSFPDSLKASKTSVLIMNGGNTNGFVRATVIEEAGQDGIDNVPAGSIEIRQGYYPAGGGLTNLDGRIYKATVIVRVYP